MSTKEMKPDASNFVRDKNARDQFEEKTVKLNNEDTGPTERHLQAKQRTPLTVEEVYQMVERDLNFRLNFVTDTMGWTPQVAGADKRIARLAVIDMIQGWVNVHRVANDGDIAPNLKSKPPKAPATKKGRKS